MQSFERLEGRVVLSGPPTATIGSPAGIHATGVTVTAAVNPNGEPTLARFQFSTSPAFTPSVARVVASQLGSMRGVVVNAAGNLFYVDSANGVLNEVLPTGAVQAVASGFRAPQGLAIDGAGNLYVADTGNGAVKKVQPSGTVTTVASGLFLPFGVAVDASGNVFATDSHANSVIKVLPNGTMTTLASGFNGPTGLAVDAAGNVFVADQGNKAVERITPAGQVSVVASGLVSPTAVAVDAAGNLFIADTGSGVKELSTSNGLLPLGAGITFPVGVAVDANDNVFVTDQGNSRIAELSIPTVPSIPAALSGSAPTLITGTLNGLQPATTYFYRVVASNADGTSTDPSSAAPRSFHTLPLAAVTTGAATAITTSGATLAGAVNPNSLTTIPAFQVSTSPFFIPSVTAVLASNLGRVRGIAVDASGNVFYADNANGLIKEVLQSGISQTLASGLNSPQGVAMDGAGDLLITDSGNGALRKLQPSTVLSTIASGIFLPYGVAVDAAGDVFFTDSRANAVKKAAPDGTITTIASGFNGPNGLAVDASGNVFVADQGNRVVKKVAPNGQVSVVASGFRSPVDVAVDAAGDLFVADVGGGVREIVPGGNSFTLGTGITFPVGVDVDGAGNVYVLDQGNGRIVEISPMTVAATPFPLTDPAATPVSAALTGLQPGTTYYYRALASNVAGSVLDPLNPPNSFTTLPGAANADLAASARAGNPSLVVVGRTLFETFVVTNRGPGRARNVVLSGLPLPRGIQFLASTAGHFHARTRQLIVPLGNLRAGASRLVRIALRPRATAGGTTLTDGFHVTARSFDPIAANNLAQIRTAILAAPPPPQRGIAFRGIGAANA